VEAVSCCSILKSSMDLVRSSALRRRLHEDAVTLHMVNNAFTQHIEKSVIHVGA
jgi:hypothetical protein